MFEELMEGFSKRFGLPGWVAGAAAVALIGSPTVRKTARKIVVSGIGGLLLVAAAARQAGVQAKREWDSLVAEASMGAASEAVSMAVDDDLGDPEPAE